MFCESTVKTGSFPSQSFNILTWEQVLGEEKASNIFPVVDSIYETKKDLIECKIPSCLDDCNVSYYDMHDGKMIYMLTGHSLYS